MKRRKGRKCLNILADIVAKNLLLARQGINK